MIKSPNVVRKNAKLTLLLAATLFGTVQAQASLEQCDSHLLTVEADGTISAGTKEKLVTAYRKGAPIRVGWELDWNNDNKVDITHWTSAMFLTEFEGNIIAQIPQIQQQRARRGHADIIFPDKSQQWFGLLRSDGQLKGRYENETGMSKSYNVKSIWCLGGY